MISRNCKKIYICTPNNNKLNMQYIIYTYAHHALDFFKSTALFLTNTVLIEYNNIFK